MNIFNWVKRMKENYSSEKDSFFLDILEDSLQELELIIKRFELKKITQSEFLERVREKTIMLYISDFLGDDPLEITEKVSILKKQLETYRVYFQ